MLDFAGLAFFLCFFFTPGFVLGLAFLLALPFFLVRCAFLPQCGQARGPWVASTRRAIAICSALLALCALLAYFLPPCAFQVEEENCSPP